MPDRPVIFLAFANDKVDNARYLRNLPMEMSGIRKALYEAEDAELCEVVERANATIEDILDIFQDNRYKDRIAVFHYGGHADGYQLLLEQLDGSHSIAHGAGLVSFLAKQKGLKLIFFNGCSTQQQAIELVQGGVPIVVGTSQAISDDVATSLAVRFYSGIANGASIGRAWAEAIDLIKIQKGGENTRGLYRKSAVQEVEDRLPWEMHLKTGAEMVKEWNLPEAVENPLFGLPEIPSNYDLPDEPFIFLGRYERKHAEVFFGRSYYIRDLYNRISSKNSAPIILLYGQSGVGKSSLLDAGLLPRLEREYHISYVRRVRELGLSGTLREALEFTADKEKGQNGQQKNEEEAQHLQNINFLKTLEQVAQLENIALNAENELQKELLGVISRLKKQKEEIFTFESKRNRFEKAKAVAEDIQELRVSRKGVTNTVFGDKRFQQSENESEDANELLRFWKAKEKKLKKPVIIILDQVEEVFTQPNFALPEELEMFLEDLDMIFKNPQNRPQGKVILSYRKEYHPEIEELLKIHAIPRENVFLTHLDRKDIADVVNGLTRTEKSKKKYRLEVQDKLAEIIADDMLEDKDSSIAPVLQILLTKMWNLIAQDEFKIFSVDKYQELRKEGVLLGDFFYQQMSKLRAWNPELEQSGLALDLLNYHTTDLGTADTRDFAQIGQRYGGRSEVVDLLYVCKDLYLLTDRSSEVTGLAHDTLAPLIQNEYKKSDLAGQRAARILESKVADFEDNKKIFIDEMDLGFVEAGAAGMRSWTENESKLVEASRKRRSKKIFWRRLRVFSIFLATAIIGGLAIFANQEREKAELRREDAERMESIAKYQTKKAIEARDSFQVERTKAEQATIEAFRQELKAKSEASKAQKQELIAKDSAESARKQREKAVKAQKAAEESEFFAKEGTFLAEISGMQAKQQNAESKLSEFTSKARELAILSIAQIDNTDFKSRMAVTSFLLQENGIKNAIRKLNEVRQEYEKSSTFTPEIKRTSSVYRKSYGALLALQDQLNKLDENNKISPEVFSALRKSYIAENSDVLQTDNESWTLAFTKDDELIFNHQNNGLSKGLIINNPEGLPKLRGLETLNARSSRNSPRNLLISNDKVFCSTVEGKIMAWELANPTRTETLVSDEHGSILTMSFSESQNSLFYAIQGNIYKYDLKSRTPSMILKNTSSIKGLILVEKNTNSFLIFADEQGNIQLLNLNSPQPMPKILYHQASRPIYALAYLPHKDCIIAGDVGGRLIALLNITPENLQKNDFVPKAFIDKKHKGIVRNITLSHNGKYLLTSSWDGSLLLWETTEVKIENMFTIQPLLEIQHERKILATQFDNKGEYFFFSDENSLHLCPTNPKIFYEKICQKLKQQKEEPKEWKDFYNREDNKLIRKDCKCVSCQ
jgi:WD40 repeat protein